MIRHWQLILTTLITFSLQGMQAPEKVTITRPPLTRLFQAIKQPTITPQEGTVTLISSDNKRFTIPRSVAELSQTIQQFIEQVGTEEAIPLQATSSKLSLISKSLQRIATLTTPQENYGQALAQALNPLFLGQPYTRIINALAIANYLDISVLIDYITALIASELTTNTNINEVEALTKMLANSSPDIRTLVANALTNLGQDFIQKNNLFPQLQLLKALKAHTSWVESVAISSDGKYLLTGSRDTTARYWDLETGQIIKVLKGHTHTVHSVAISSDGKYALTGSDDNTARLWDLETGKTIKVLKGHTGGIQSVAISPNGKYALTGSYDDTARYWDLETGNTIKVLTGHTSWVKSVAFSPKGKHALTGSWDNTARLWDLDTGETIKVLEGHTSYITSVAISPDGKYALTGSRDTTARYWDLETGQIIKVLEGHTDIVTSVAISPDGKYALTGSWDTTVRYWNLKTGETIKVLTATGRPSAGLFIASVAISPDGTKALTSDIRGNAYLWTLPIYYELTLPMLVFINRLSKPATKHRILANPYFRAEFNKLPNPVRVILLRLHLE